eukprot:TRINITY_DN56111_c0_g1_i1.p1 TRINITY_DN56111_c0_g1~~TRINITY_DN56111_c0_g1_i1.p1  ORF type:complete len:123 (-),score=26.21 TRINITY_DN56111_c0_g1_i1:116-484(-)
MPAVNQLELHPRFASPNLQEVARRLGVVLTGYGTGNSVAVDLGKDEVVKEIADRVDRPPLQVVLRWTLQRGVAAIPRSSSPVHIAENLTALDWELAENDMLALDMLNPVSYTHLTLPTKRIV